MIPPWKHVKRLEIWRPAQPRLARSPPSISSSASTLPIHPSLRTPPPVRLERKTHRNPRHDDVQRRADVNRDGRPRPRVRRHDGADDPHDPVPADGKPVARAAVRRGQDLGRVRVQRAVVDVEAEVDDAGEGCVLGLRADLWLLVGTC